MYCQRKKQHLFLAKYSNVELLQKLLTTKVIQPKFEVFDFSPLFCGI